MLEFKTEHGIAVLTLAREDALNALAPELICRLRDAWCKVRDTPSIRVAIITGRGDKAFCVGGDLKLTIPLVTGERQPESKWDHEFMNDPNAGAFALLHDIDPGKPIIAAVNGDAIGGGMEMLLGTDIRVASPNARFGLQEVQWGLFPNGGSTVRLPKQIPRSAAMEMLLTGRLFSAEDCYKFGLISHISEHESVLDTALSIARRIARNGPLAVQETRRAVNEARDIPDQTMALRHARKIGDDVFRSSDAREGPKAFSENRLPAFTGR